jgi:hypothetical protein
MVVQPDQQDASENNPKAIQRTFLIRLGCSPESELIHETVAQHPFYPGSLPPAMTILKCCNDVELPVVCRCFGETRESSVTARYDAITISSNASRHRATAPIAVLALSM